MRYPLRLALEQCLYDALLCVLLPVALLRLLWRSRNDAAYRRRIGERLGRYAAAPARVELWLHAVSVGELLAALPLLEALRAERPRAQVLVTTTTPAASRLLRERLGGSVLHAWAPWDLPCVVRRFLDHFAPRAAIVMETELWPNQLAACHARGIPLLLANARLSARSAARYARAGALARAMLERLHRVAAQSEADAARFRALGVPPARVVVTGSLKWDVPLPVLARERAARLRSAWTGGAARPVWIAASTHPGEEQIVLDALRRLHALHPGLLLLLAPRHAERAAAVAALARQAGFAARLRSAAAEAAGLEVLVIDTVGELPLLFGAADLAFVGGSLVPRGGHNLAEPAAWGLPLLAGPSLFNFSAMAESFAGTGALTPVHDADSLAQAVAALLADAAQHTRAGAAARAVVDAHRGAGARLLGEVLSMLP